MDVAIAVRLVARWRRPVLAGGLEVEAADAVDLEGDGIRFRGGVVLSSFQDRGRHRIGSYLFEQARRRRRCSHTDVADCDGDSHAARVGSGRRNWARDRP